MELGEMRQRIKDTSLVQKLPENMRQRFVMMVLAASDTKEVSREEKIFEQGAKDIGQGCIIIEGMVSILTDDVRTKTIEAPDILGEVQLFTPEGARTATVEVIVGGRILLFEWNELSGLCRTYYTEEEFETLRKVVHESAWAREKDLFERIKAGKK